MPAQALEVARDLVVELLAARPDLAAKLVAHGQRVAVMAEDESTTDLPEQRDWKKPARDDPRLTRCERKHYAERIGQLSDRQYWDARARGMAGLLTSGGAEDLLGLPHSRYAGQDIFVHEMGHDVFDAIYAADRPLHARIQAAYRHAMAAGLWKGEYASTTVTEYWAVGTQFWFDDAPVARFDGHTVLSHEDLAAYDPALASALRAAYGERHRLAADRWWRSPLRVPPGPLPANTAEVC
ncbi:glycoside hydrolase [Sphingomonas bacterium]|uniref:glycoside hydrolase n=1 Tax=Sphingomonas bacterium TaxID=1895847 RepID=UPI0020C6F654|nr:glycoside hydrolase [Sphingomonas bacterium]